MKTSQAFIYLVLLALQLSGSQTQNPPDFSTVGGTAACSLPFGLTVYELPWLSSPRTQLSIDATLEVLADCPGTSTAFLFELVGSGFGGVEISYLSFSFSPASSSGVFKFYAGDPDSNGEMIKSVVTSSGSAVGQHEFFATIDLSSYQASAALLFPGGSLAANSAVDPALWSASSVFDASTKFLFCGRADGSSPLMCQIQNIAFWFTALPGKAGYYIYGIYPTVLGEYQMVNQEATGLIPNSEDGTPLGSLAISSTMAWDSAEKMGYRFSGPNGLQFRASDLGTGSATSTYQKSISISFWIKVNAIPAQPEYLFRYYYPSTQSDRLSLILLPTREIKFGFGSQSGISFQPLPMAAWKLITANFLAALPGGMHVFSLYFEDVLAMPIPFMMPALGLDPSFDDAVDVLLFGGAGITMYDLKIFSPGSRLVAKPPLSSSSCLLYLGGPSTCLWKLPCSSVGCGTCSSDFCSSCIEGYQTAFTKCNPCPTATYYSASSTPKACLSCSSNCRTCDDATTCTECETNYILLNGVCINSSPCPSDPTYYLYTEDKVCRETCSYPNVATVVSPVNKYCTLDIDPSDYEEVKGMVNGAQAGGTASTVFGLLASLVDSSSPSAFTMASLTKMLQYMKFLQIGYPPKLYLMLLLQKTASGGLNFVPEMSDSMKKKIPDNELPIQFAIHKVHSNFLVGFWQPFMSMVIIVGVIGILYLMEIYMKDYKKVHSVVLKITPHLRWNLFLTIFCSNFCDLAFYTAANFMSVNFEAGIAVFGFLICLTLNTLAFFVMGLMIQTIVALQTARSHKSKEVNLEEDAKKQNQKYSMVFEPYHEKSFWQQGFVMFFSIRAYVYSAIVGYLYHYPVLQAVLLFLLPVVGLCYLFVKKPMKIMINFIQLVFCEIILSSVNLCVLIMAIIDQKDPLSTSKKEALGVFVMGINLVISWCLPVFTVAKVIYIVREQMKARKLAKQQKPPIGETDMNLQTTVVDPVSSQKIPRIQAARPVSTYDHELSSYQISDYDNSMIELRRNPQQMSHYQ